MSATLGTSTSTGAPKRSRLWLEVAIACACGAVPIALDAIYVHLHGDWDFGSTLVKALVRVPQMLLSPGTLIGGAVGGVMDIGGFTTNWAWLNHVEDTTSTIANFLVLPLFWYAWRTLPRASLFSRVLQVALGVWLCFGALMLLVFLVVRGG